MKANTQCGQGKKADTHTRTHARTRARQPSQRVELESLISTIFPLNHPRTAGERFNALSQQSKQNTTRPRPKYLGSLTSQGCHLVLKPVQQTKQLKVFISSTFFSHEGHSFVTNHSCGGFRLLSQSSRLWNWVCFLACRSTQLLRGKGGQSSPSSEIIFLKWSSICDSS